MAKFTALVFLCFVFEICWAGKCPVLNADTDGVAHPDSDEGCGSGLPGWTAGSLECQCEYFVKQRDEQGCATQYYSKCLRLKTLDSVYAPESQTEFDNYKHDIPLAQDKQDGLKLEHNVIPKNDLGVF